MTATRQVQHKLSKMSYPKQFIQWVENMTPKDFMEVLWNRMSTVEQEELWAEEIEDISSHPTLKFNPYLDIVVNDGDVYGMTLKEAIEKLIFCDDTLIYKNKEPNFIKRWGPKYERREANLYELLSHECIPDPPASYVLWFEKELNK